MLGDLLRLLRSAKVNQMCLVGVSRSESRLRNREDQIIKSNYEPDHAPGFEILLNKEKVLDWSHFDLELAFPVKKMKGA